MIEQLASDLRVIALPLRTNFRGLSVRETALFEGPHGWAEFAPFTEYDHQESVPWLNSALEAAFAPRPTLHRDSVAVNATIPATNDPAIIEELLTRYSGCQVAKVKLTGDSERDMERVSRVRSIAPEIRLRFDVNGGWSVDQALANTYLLYEKFSGIEYIEQPCATLQELREFKERQQVNALICGDEIIRKSLEQSDLSDAVDIIMLKVAPLGGITKAHEIAALHKKPVVISSALESAVGISYGLTLAASFPHQEYAAGLATGELFQNDIATHPIRDGEIKVRTITPQAGYEASPERRAWWQNRLREVWRAGSHQFAQAKGWA